MRTAKPSFYSKMLPDWTLTLKMSTRRVLGLPTIESLRLGSMECVAEDLLCANKDPTAATPILAYAQQISRQAVQILRALGCVVKDRLATCCRLRNPSAIIHPSSPSFGNKIEYAHVHIHTHKHAHPHSSTHTNILRTTHIYIPAKLRSALPP